MSIEALNWALNLAPTPMDSGDKPNPACAAVLVGLANHAGPDGTAAFPSVATLVRYTRLSERTVRTALDRLEAEGIIRACDPDIIAAYIKRGDRRPKGWDLGLGLVRTDLTPEEVQQMSRVFPGLQRRVDAARVRGVQSLHPVNGVQPTSERGATDAERGAAVAPEPSLNHPRNQEPPPASQGTPRPKAEPRGTRLPDGWQPDESLIEWATGKGVTDPALLALWTERFTNHWAAAAGRNATKRNWSAAWRNWVLEEITRAARYAPRGTVDVFAAAEARALEAERMMMTPDPLAITTGGLA